jgi:Asp-tRNA(Asn)/Glu-tRNA(Gln) amidotransferase A subunit family amidase
MYAPSVEIDLFESIERLEALFEDREPFIQAFLPEASRFTRLRKEAELLLDRYPPTKQRPALMGMLAGVKDIFRVDGFATQAGSRLPPGVLGGSQAESVSRLKAAGALIVGKTVTTEFAYFSPGPTTNPHNPAHTPGGSSSGSAAGVAAGLCTMALGTQTIGSIIRPAAFCGAVGLKPTYDRISREGVIPLSPSLDHVGFFTPDVTTGLRVARCVYTDWIEPVAPITRPILGIPEGPYLESAAAATLLHFRETCQCLRDVGYDLRSVPVMSDFDQIRARHEVILSAEAARVHAGWFKDHGELYQSKTAELMVRGQAVSDGLLAQALEGRASLESTGDPIMNLPWTQAGLPTLSLPAGNSDEGLPLGLQVTGQWGADESLLTSARGLEKALGQL